LLAIDCNRNPVNANFTAKFPTKGVPMFLVIDPFTEKVRLSWWGTASVAHFATIMDDGLRAAAGAAGADAALARADEANARMDFAKAAESYTQALEFGDKNWPKRARTIESLVMAYSQAKDQAGCMEASLKLAPSMARDRSFVRNGKTSRGDGQHSAGILRRHLAGRLAFHYRQEKNEKDAIRVTNARIEYLQRQLARTKNPEARLALDLDYVSAANFVHKPEPALANLERDEHELPHDYNPPCLLASQLSQMKRYDDALAACDRALRVAYGGVKLRVYALKGQILERKGDKAAAKKVYEEGIAFANTLPPDTGKVGQQRIRAALSKL
jgi:tetratricopeptide (TPR) repeat protein